jgi:hypothetical protein
MELLDLEGSELAVQPYINSSIPYSWSGSSKDIEWRTETTFIPYPFLILVSVSMKFTPQMDWILQVPGPTAAKQSK